MFLLAGDFRKTLEVITRVTVCVKRSVLCGNVQAVLLTINTRVQLGANTGDREFSSDLLETEKVPDVDD